MMTADYDRWGALNPIVLFSDPVCTDRHGDCCGWGASKPIAMNLHSE